MLENRILEVFKYSKLSRVEFAEKLQISNAVISHISSGRNKASTELIINVLNAFPEVSIEWLMLGKGDMFKQDAAKQAILIKEKLLNAIQELNKHKNQIENQINLLNSLVNDLK